MLFGGLRGETWCGRIIGVLWLTSNFLLNLTNKLNQVSEPGHPFLGHSLHVRFGVGSHRISCVFGVGSPVCAVPRVSVALLVVGAGLDPRWCCWWRQPGKSMTGREAAAARPQCGGGARQARTQFRPKATQCTLASNTSSVIGMSSSARRNHLARSPLRPEEG